MSEENLTMADILKYAVRIENESKLFYEDTTKRIVDKDVKALVTELRDEEVKHESRLLNISIEKEEIEVLDFNSDEIKTLITNSKINENATPKEVLEVALNREKNTRDFYQQISTLTNIDADVIDIFQMLFEQESGHATRIEKMLEKI